MFYGRLDLLEETGAIWRRERSECRNIRVFREGGKRVATVSSVFRGALQIFRSLGAKAQNYDILLPDGDVLHLTEGSRISNIEVIAGKGRERTIDYVDMLIGAYGGKASEWQKVKGIGFLDVDGESYKAELHWYQEPSVGKVDWKLKPQKGGEYFID